MARQTEAQAASDPTNFHGYQQAARIDRQIDAQLKIYPISGCNSMSHLREWMLFSRTLQTSLDLLNAAAAARLKQIVERGE